MSSKELSATYQALLRTRALLIGHRHMVNRIHHEEASFGERLAGRIASGIGSWTFLIVQTLAVLVWLAANLWLAYHWDPFPFILLNLLFSVQAAYTGPVLLLAGNRQSQKDRLTLEHASTEAERAETTTQTVLEEIKRNTEICLELVERMEAHMKEHHSQDRF